MNFDRFVLNESKNAGAKSLLDVVSAAVGDKYGEIYVVPDFDTFDRSGEPEQNSTLFGTKSGESFAVNATADGKPYSVDFWKKDSKEPDMTVYVGEHDLASVLSTLVEGGKANEAGYSPGDPLVLQVVDDENDKKPAKKETKKIDKKEAPKKEAPKNVVVAKKNPAPKTEYSKEAVQPNVIPSVSKNPAKKDPQLKEPYEYQDPDTIFDDLRMYTDMVIDGTQPSMLITGGPGTGKTYNVEKQMKKAGLVKDKDYYHAKGKATAAGMYQTLYEQNGKLIVFDDMDSIFKDDNAVNLLKGALDSAEVREISWLSAKPIKTPEGALIPNKFEFTGRVIFISNLAQRDIDDAIKSRSFVIEVALSPEDMVKYIEGMFDRVMQYERVSVKRYALAAIKAAAAVDPKVQINMRTFIKAVKIVKAVKDKGVVDRMIIQQCSYK